MQVEQAIAQLKPIIESLETVATYSAHDPASVLLSVLRGTIVSYEAGDLLLFARWVLVFSAFARNGELGKEFIDSTGTALMEQEKEIMAAFTGHLANCAPAKKDGH